MDYSVDIFICSLRFVNGNNTIDMKKHLFNVVTISSALAGATWGLWERDFGVGLMGLAVGWSFGFLMTYLVMDKE